MKRNAFLFAFIMSTGFMSTCALTGCNYLANFRTHTQQGNIIKEEQVAKLKVGMSKMQVAELMGYPVYENTFEEDRWVYIYTLQTSHNPLVRKHVAVEFRNDRVEKIEREDV